MQNSRLTKVSVILALSALIIALCRLDIMLCAVMTILLIATLYPYRREHSFYTGIIIKSSVLSSTLVLSAELFDLSGIISNVLYGGISVGWLLILLAMSCVAMTAGMMISICFNHFTSAEISKRWMLLFALAFTVGVASVYMFPLSIDLYLSGYAVFNDDVRLDFDRISDRILMAPSLCAIVVSFIWSVGLRKCSVAYDRNSMLQEERA